MRDTIRLAVAAAAALSLTPAWAGEASDPAATDTPQHEASEVTGDPADGKEATGADTGSGGREPREAQGAAPQRAGEEAEREAVERAARERVLQETWAPLP